MVERSEPTRLTARAEDTERRAPLVVDLDGTLVATDLLIESLFVLAKRMYCSPFSKLPLREWRGRDARLR